MRKFLGFTSYYRKFVKDYGKIVKPLNDLLIGHLTNNRGKGCSKGKSIKEKTKSVPWIWGECQQKARDIIIEKLTSPPVLTYADYSMPFKIHTDTNGDGLGAVLYQNRDRVDHVIAYASRGLRGSEKLYLAHKREFLALKWVVTDQFSDYLIGAKFEVKTDSNPLTYVLDKAKLDATSQRWVASLADYDFTITYRSDKLNVDADILSLVRPEENISSNVIKAVCTSIIATSPINPNSESVLLTQNVYPFTSETDLRTEVRSEYIGCENYTRTRSITEVRKLLFFKNGILYRKCVLSPETVHQLVLPDAFRDVTLTGLHDNAGHQGRNRTLYLIKSRFFWPGMDRDVGNRVSSCTNCMLRKTKAKRSADLVIITSDYPLELICIDFLTLDKCKGGYPQGNGQCERFNQTLKHARYTQ